MKRWALGLVVAVAAAGLTGLAAGWWSARPGLKGPAQPGPAETVLQFQAREFTSPERLTLADVVEIAGPLVAPATAVVRARSGGTLLSLKVVEGSRVAAGQPLGTLDVPEVSSRVAERSALLESARAGVLQAERAHAQNENLATQRFISPAALDSSRSALETARAQLAAAEAALSSVRASLRDSALVAPIGGIVSKRHALAGEKLAPEQPVVTLVDLARLELAGSVGTHLVSRLEAGQPVQVYVEGMNAPLAGRVARIAPAAEPGTRAIGVTVELPNPGERLRAGQYAVARARLADPEPRWTLPETAVVHSGGQPQVWVLQDGCCAGR